MKIFLGRGNGVAKKPGNQLYRKTIRDKKAFYRGLKTNREKEAAALEVIKELQNKGAKFYYSKIGKGKTEWVKAPADVVLAKVKQALRERHQPRVIASTTTPSPTNTCSISKQPPNRSKVEQEQNELHPRNSREQEYYQESVFYHASSTQVEDVRMDHLLNTNHQQPMLLSSFQKYDHDQKLSSFSCFSSDPLLLHGLDGDVIMSSYSNELRRPQQKSRPAPVGELLLSGKRASNHDNCQQHQQLDSSKYLASSMKHGDWCEKNDDTVQSTLQQSAKDTKNKVVEEKQHQEVGAGLYASEYYMTGGEGREKEEEEIHNYFSSAANLDFEPIHIGEKEQQDNHMKIEIMKLALDNIESAPLVSSSTTPKTLSRLGDHSLKRVAATTTNFAGQEGRNVKKDKNCQQEPFHQHESNSNHHLASSTFSDDNTPKKTSDLCLTMSPPLNNHYSYLQHPQHSQEQESSHFHSLTPDKYQDEKVRSFVDDVKDHNMKPKSNHDHTSNSFFSCYDNQTKNQHQTNLHKLLIDEEEEQENHYTSGDKDGEQSLSFNDPYSCRQFSSSATRADDVCSRSIRSNDGQLEVGGGGNGYESWRAIWRATHHLMNHEWLQDHHIYDTDNEESMEQKPRHQP